MGQLIIYSLLGYVIGSISPGYIFGRLLKGIDIRNYGNHNTGATNTSRVVGQTYGLITGVFDYLKAPLAYYLSLNTLDPETWESGLIQDIANVPRE